MKNFFVINLKQSIIYDQCLKYLILCYNDIMDNMMEMKKKMDLTNKQDLTVLIDD